VALPLLESPLLLPLLLMLVVDCTWHRLGMPSTVLLGALPSAASSACAALAPARWGPLLSCIAAAGTGRSGTIVMMMAALPANGTACYIALPVAAPLYLHAADHHPPHVRLLYICRPLAPSSASERWTCESMQI
jgi:hypothetical protein